LTTSGGPYLVCIAAFILLLVASCLVAILQFYGLLWFCFIKCSTICTNKYIGHLNYKILFVFLGYAM